MTKAQKHEKREQLAEKLLVSMLSRTSGDDYVRGHVSLIQHAFEVADDFITVAQGLAKGQSIGKATAAIDKQSQGQWYD